MEQQMTFIQGRTAKQVQWLMWLSALLFVILFVFQPFGQYLFVSLLVLSSGAVGYGSALLLGLMSNSADFKMTLSKKSRLWLSLAVGLMVGFTLSHLSSLMSLLPSSSMIELISPRIIFYVGGFLLSFVGYILGWRSTPS